MLNMRKSNNYTKRISKNNLECPVFNWWSSCQFYMTWLTLSGYKIKKIVYNYC